MRPSLFEQYSFSSTYTLCEFALHLSWKDKVICYFDSLACGTKYEINYVEVII